ncbi:MAG: LPS assembly lipoprotein LptE [Verrucomicrobia bacterium]|nr:LPS assembly lipoprotein LptE [Verrucomicrobiota bacterium]
MKLPLLLPLVPLLLVSCAGYHLGSAKPAALAKVKTIAVRMFANATLHPRAETIATSAVTSALTQDGTFRLTSTAQADAILEGSISSITYSPISDRRLNTLHPEELTNTVTLTWFLKDASTPTRILASGVAVGTSQLFVDPDLQTARNNALPDALERAGEAIASRLASGF